MEMMNLSRGPFANAVQGTMIVASLASGALPAVVEAETRPAPDFSNGTDATDVVADPGSPSGQSTGSGQQQTGQNGRQQYNQQFLTLLSSLPGGVAANAGERTECRPSTEEGKTSGPTGSLGFGRMLTDLLSSVISIGWTDQAHKTTEQIFGDIDFASIKQVNFQGEPISIKDGVPNIAKQGKVSTGLLPKDLSRALIIGTMSDHLDLFGLFTVLDSKEEFSDLQKAGILKERVEAEITRIKAEIEILERSIEISRGLAGTSQRPSSDFEVEPEFTSDDEEPDYQANVEKYEKDIETLNSHIEGLQEVIRYAELYPDLSKEGRARREPALEAKARQILQAGISGMLMGFSANEPRLFKWLMCERAEQDKAFGEQYRRQNDWKFLHGQNMEIENLRQDRADERADAYNDTLEEVANIEAKTELEGKMIEWCISGTTTGNGLVEIWTRHGLGANGSPADSHPVSIGTVKSSGRTGQITGPNGEELSSLTHSDGPASGKPAEHGFIVQYGARFVIRLDELQNWCHEKHGIKPKEVQTQELVGPN